MEKDNCVCIICNINFQSELSCGDEQTRKNICGLFQDIWKLFCQLFNLSSSQWESIKIYYSTISDIPFCTNCRNRLAHLLILHQQLESIKQKIGTIKTSVIQTIIETSSNSNCDPLQDLTVEPRQNEESTLNYNKIQSLRQTIFQSFTPSVLLVNCNYQKQNSTCPLNNNNNSNISIGTLLGPLEVEKCQDSLITIKTEIDDEPDQDHDPLEYNSIVYEIEEMPFILQQVKLDIEEPVQDPLMTDKFDDNLNEIRENQKSIKIIKSKINGFASSSSRKRVLSNPPKCVLCNGKSFSSNFGLLRHMHDVHKKTPKTAKKYIRKNKTPKLNVVGKHHDNFDENKFEYGGWTFEKTDNGFLCICGVEHKFMASMRAHILVQHFASRNPAQFPKKGAGDKAIKIGKGKWVYKKIWKFQELPDGRLECESCLEIFSNRKRTVEHIKTRHVPESCRFYCKECNCGFSGRAQFLKHQNQHKRCRYKEVGPGSYIYDDKFEFDAVDDGFQCGTCGLNKKTRYDMSRHIHDIHSNPERTFCSGCGANFTSRCSREKHAKKTCGKKGFRLDGDTRKLLYKDKWPVEIIVDPSDDSKDRFKCGTCGQERKNRAAMFLHIRNGHISIIQFNCDLCDKIYPTQYQLKVHMESKHSEFPQYLCKFVGCGKRFNTKRYQTIHLSKCKFRL